MKNLFLKLLFLLLPVFIFSQKMDQRNLDGKIAIRGYDPVAYIIQNKAVKGDKSFSVDVNGATYYTSSAKNQQLLKSNPSKYEPAYGGWCAFAIGDSGEKVSIDPKTFKIIDGKTYLFYNQFFNNTLKTWNKNEPILKTNADKNWKKYSK